MSAIPREWLKLQYMDPARFLVGLRHIALTMPLDELHYKVSSLRTHALRKAGESRQAALFAYGLGQVLRAPVAFAVSEAKDYDAVVKYPANGAITYLPVQLKEWVPEFLNPSATLQGELDKLSKYTDSKDLAVAIHLNREATIHLSDLTLPQGSIGGLWLYGATDLLQEKWRIIGNLVIPGASAFEFHYPGG